MSKLYMPMFWGDYLANTGHLTTAEHGAYMLLIAHYWEHEGLPVDENQIRRITKLTSHSWARSRDTIAALFGPGWVHDKIIRTLQYQKIVSGRQSLKAKKRWENNDSVDAAALPRQCLPSSKTISNKKEEERESATSVAPAPEASADSLPAKRSEPAPPSKRRGTRLPEDWQPSAADLNFAAEQGLRGDVVAREIEKFRDYWNARAGPGGVKLDWSATWRNWIRRVTEDRRGSNGMETDRDRRKRESREALAELRAFGEGRGHGDFSGEVVQLLPRPAAGGGPESVPNGGGGSVLPVSAGGRGKSG